MAHFYSGPKVHDDVKPCFNAILQASIKPKRSNRRTIRQLYNSLSGPFEPEIVDLANGSFTFNNVDYDLWEAAGALKNHCDRVANAQELREINNQIVNVLRAIEKCEEILSPFSHFKSDDQLYVNDLILGMASRKRLIEIFKKCMLDNDFNSIRQANRQQFIFYFFRFLNHLNARFSQEELVSTIVGILESVDIKIQEKTVHISIERDPELLQAIRSLA